MSFLRCHLVMRWPSPSWYSLSSPPALVVIWHSVDLRIYYLFSYWSGNSVRRNSVVFLLCSQFLGEHLVSGSPQCVLAEWKSSGQPHQIPLSFDLSDFDLLFHSVSGQWLLPLLFQPLGLPFHCRQRPDFCLHFCTNNCCSFLTHLPHWGGLGRRWWWWYLLLPARVPVGSQQQAVLGAPDCSFESLSVLFPVTVRTHVTGELGQKAHSGPLRLSLSFPRLLNEVLARRPRVWQACYTVYGHHAGPRSLSVTHYQPLLRNPPLGCPLDFIITWMLWFESLESFTVVPALMSLSFQHTWSLTMTRSVSGPILVSCHAPDLIEMKWNLILKSCLTAVYFDMWYAYLIIIVTLISDASVCITCYMIFIQ